MTFTFNGVGTTYSQAQHRFLAPGRCGACGRFAPLASYDTHLAVALLYIPTVRLKALRVMAQCSSCERHVRMDHAEWIAAKAAALQALNEARAKGSPTDVGAAFAALGAIAAPADVSGVIDAVRAAVGDDPAGLAHVGAGLLAVSDLDGAKAALERSVAVAPSTEAELQLGFVELCRDCPVAAHARLECVWRNRVRDGVDVALLLIDCLLAHGESTLAARVADRLAAAFPDLADHRELRDLTRVAKAQPQGQRAFRLKHRALVPVSAAAPIRNTPQTATTRRRDRLILAGIGAFLVAGVVAASVAALHLTPVYVVSGASVAYDVDIDGERVQLQPGAVLKRNLGLLRRQVVVHAPSGARTLDVDFGASVVTALYQATLTNVINPDGLAVVVREEIEYATRFRGDESDNGRHEFDVLTGTVIDARARFAFQPYPKNISMKGSSEMVSRISVDGSGPFAATALLRLKRGPAAARAHALARLAFNPGDVDALDVALAAPRDADATNDDPNAPAQVPADLLAAVDAVLAARPVDVEGWLRASAAGLVDDDHIDALSAAVDADANNADPCAAYLAMALGAERTPPRVARAAGCINERLEAGIRAAVDGDIDTARAVLRSITTSRLTPYRFERWSLLALLLDERAALVEEVQRALDPTSFVASNLLLGMAVRHNDLPEARKIRREALDGVDDDGATAAYFDFVFAYNLGAVDEAIAALAKLPEPLRAEFDLERMLVTGAFAEERAHIGEHSIDEQLLYWAAVLAREPQRTEARNALAALLTRLDQPSWMRAAPRVEALSALGADWPLRRATALALGVLHDNAALLDEATRLCRPTSPPTLLVRQLRAP